jgi:hypothetical protein
MRSSDIWFGLPYDIFSFTMWANCLATLLRVEPGSLTMYLDSSHLYSTEKGAALQVLSSPPPDTLISPRLPELPKDRWLKDALAGRQVDLLANAWDQYALALSGHTSKEALLILENLQWLAKL